MDQDIRDRSTRALERARDLGFALAGVCDARASDYSDELRAWIGAGKHGSMRWMEEHAAERLDPGVLLPGARSLLMVGDVYERRGTPSVETPAGVGRIARYARGDDYHKVMKKRLIALADALREEHPEAQFKVFVDTAPVLEREHGARAGLGWVGKHTLLIHPVMGSYFFLGGIVTTLALEANSEPIEDHCGTCTRCIDACPTDAITPYSVDATKCVSYLTIERREAIAAELHAGIGDWIYGCDICQEVCPHNSPRSDEAGERLAEAQDAYAPRRTSFDLLEVLGWTTEDRQRAFTKSAMKRARLEMMKRNALIALTNREIEDGGDARVVEDAMSDDEPLVRDTARQSVDRIRRIRD